MLVMVLGHVIIYITINTIETLIKANLYFYALLSINQWHVNIQPSIVVLSFAKECIYGLGSWLHDALINIY